LQPREWRACRRETISFERGWKHRGRIAAKSLHRKAVRPVCEASVRCVSLIGFFGRDSLLRTFEARRAYIWASARCK